MAASVGPSGRSSVTGPSKSPGAGPNNSSPHTGTPVSPGPPAGQGSGPGPVMCGQSRDHGHCCGEQEQLGA